MYVKNSQLGSKLEILTYCYFVSKTNRGVQFHDYTRTSSTAVTKNNFRILIQFNSNYMHLNIVFINLFIDASLKLYGHDNRKKLMVFSSN